jgi:hypothetical protein
MGNQASTWVIEVFIFIGGLGMGSTMMPLFTGALKTLSHAQTSKGSTLINVIQQTGASVGVAVLSVVLTSELNSHPLVKAFQKAQSAALTSGKAAPSIPHSVAVKLTTQMSSSFHESYWVALGLLLAVMVPVFFLPRRKLEKTGVGELLEDDIVEPVIMH